TPTAGFCAMELHAAARVEFLAREPVDEERNEVVDRRVLSKRVVVGAAHGTDPLSRDCSVQVTVEVAEKLVHLQFELLGGHGLSSPFVMSGALPRSAEDTVVAPDRAAVHMPHRPRRGAADPRREVPKDSSCGSWGRWPICARCCADGARHFSSQARAG